MSREQIRVIGPYVLRPGMGLLDQEPYKGAVLSASEGAGFNESWDISTVLAGQIIRGAMDYQDDRPRFPVWNFAEPDQNDIDFYKRRLKELGKVYPDPIARRLVMALLGVADNLASYPNSRRYLTEMYRQYPHPYDPNDGSWRSERVIKTKKNGKHFEQVRHLGKLDLALSYPFWAVLQQMRNRIQPRQSEDIHTEAQVTGMLAGENPLVFQDRAWRLVEPPSEPFLKPPVEFLTSGQYKSNFLEQI